MPPLQLPMSAQKEQLSQVSNPAPGPCASTTQPVGRTVTTERRGYQRYAANFAVGISTVTKRMTVGLTQDISQSGALILTHSHFSVGDRLRLELRLLHGKCPAQVVDVHVVRSMPLGLESNGLWRSRIAVQFDDPLNGMDEHFEKVAETQAKQWQRAATVSSEPSSS